MNLIFSFLIKFRYYPNPKTKLNTWFCLWVDSSINRTATIIFGDHQGNLRLSFRDSLSAPVNGIYAPPVITQIREQDPFGLTIQPLSIVGVNSQNFRFQNQEKIEDFGLNLNWFKYRPFDPQTGRGWQLDELAHKYVHNSPYAFSENKVTNHIELDGLEAVSTAMLLKASTSKNVINHATKSTNLLKDALTFGGGIGIGTVGGGAKIGKIGVNGSVGFAEGEIGLGKSARTLELKGINATGEITNGKGALGGEINAIKITSDFKNKTENVDFLNTELKGISGKGELNSEKSIELEGKFGVFFGNVKADLEKVKGSTIEGFYTFGAFFSEIFTQMTNNTFQTDSEKKNTKRIY